MPRSQSLSSLLLAFFLCSTAAIALAAEASGQGGAMRRRGARQQAAQEQEAEKASKAAEETSEKAQEPEAKPAEQETEPAEKEPVEEEPAEEEPANTTLPDDWGAALEWRNIGPANQGGRITDIEVDPSDRQVWYAASASGGLFKTENGGTTFEAIFEREHTVSIGDIAVAPSDPKQIWVGTGEANVRNSVSWGDGIYKSVDGGKTWKHAGLKESRHIGRIAVHPTNPDVVYVAAVGRVWGTNPERGVYKTTDGGATWELALAVDERTGCIDLRLSPADPEILLAAMYERQRDNTDANDPIKRWGPGSGLFRSTDGGTTWSRMSEGLPTVAIGRISFDWYQKDPKVVFALIETERWAKGDEDPEEKRDARLGLQADDVDSGEGNQVVVESVVEEEAAATAGVQKGDILIKLGEREIEKYTDLRRELRRWKEGDETKIEVKRGEETIVMELVYSGEEPRDRRPFSLGLGGQRANAQDDQGDEGFQTGGVFRSDDAGVSWKRINSLNPRPYYFSQIRVDPNDDKTLFVCGTNLHRSTDGGESFDGSIGRGVHLDHHAMWIDPSDGRHVLLGNDGGVYESHDRGENWRMRSQLALGQFYHVAVDPRRDYRVYGGLQDNGSWGGPSMLRSGGGPSNYDWFQFGGGDGFVCQVDPQDPDLVYYESQNGGMGRINLRTGESGFQRPSGRGNRFNWKTPFALSHHNGQIFYCAGNKVWRSLNRGANMRALSEEISLTDKGTATAFAESPRDPDVLWVGTDDGALWVTQDGGQEWTELHERLPGLPGPRWVSSIETSRTRTGRAYVTLDGHRSDDLGFYVYVTEDYGKTFTRLAEELDDHCARVVREDLSNPEVLYLGSEFHVWASVDRGASWNSIRGNMPTVAFHELAQHPSSGELIAATHGRSVWIVDITPIRQTKEDVLKADAHLFEPAAAVLWNRTFSRRLSGHAHFVGENPPRGALLSYTLASDVEKASIEIRDLAGKKVRELRLSESDRKAGLHRKSWDLRAMDTSTPEPPAQGRRGRRRAPSPVAPGRYRAVLLVDEKEIGTVDVEVVPDPRPSVDIGTGFIPASPIR